LARQPSAVASVLGNALWATVFAMRLAHLPALFAKLIPANVGEPSIVSVKVSHAFDSAAVASDLTVDHTSPFYRVAMLNS